MAIRETVRPDDWTTFNTRSLLGGSLMVGLLDNFGKALFPELSYFTLFAPMAAILAVRPTGLFGRA